MLVEVILLIFYVQTTAFDITGSDYKPRNFANCFENLGCLDTSEEWYNPQYRPVNLEPLERHIIRTEFILIKKLSNSSDLIYDVITLKKETIALAQFKAGYNVIFLIHDFTSNGYTGWIKHMALVIHTKKSNYNIISIDWESGAEPPYDQAIANARVVALETIALILELKKNFNIQSEQIHMVGHGVGAHIAGYVGKNITKLGRITDPNGPRFAHMPSKVRLSQKDALFVEVLHTDAYRATSQGLRQRLGHADFYINNADFQPNCKECDNKDVTDVDRDYMKAGKIMPGCSHKRAFKYFIESIGNTDCKFLGIKCRNYKDFIEGKCHNCEMKNGTSACAEIDIEETPSNMNGSFYVNTRGDPPYCMQAYKVSIKINANGKSKEGKFEMIMISDNNDVANVSTIDTNLRTLIPGRTHSFIFYSSPPQLFSIKEVKLKWEHVKTIDCFIFCDESIYVEKVIVSPLSLKQNESSNSLLCPINDRMEISTGNYLTFSKCGANSTYLTGTHIPVFDAITPADFVITPADFNMTTEENNVTQFNE